MHQIHVLDDLHFHLEIQLTVRNVFKKILFEREKFKFVLEQQFVAIFERTFVELVLELLLMNLLHIEESLIPIEIK